MFFKEAFEQMKQGKKVIALLMTLLLGLSCSMTTFASSGAEYQHKEKYEQMVSFAKKLTFKPVLELEKNRMTYDGRHIKIDWEDVSGADQYIIQIADNNDFLNATTSKRLPRQGTFYNFAELENNESDYYIRIRPVFVIGKYNDRYITAMGRWSNTVFAEYVPFNIDNIEIPDRFTD